MASAAVNYFLGMVITANIGKKKAKAALVSALIINIGMLVVFKYTDFIIENVNASFSLSIKSPSLMLPLGISFYTFQAISYVVDCYWEKVKAQKSFIKFLTYISMFPHIMAGPIVRYTTIERELSVRKSSLSDLSSGFTRISIGLAKKVIIADHLSKIVESTLSGDISSVSVLGTWYGVILYSMQMYFDFSGYSDIAIGLARVFGFHFDENFNYPFICKDISEFWQRWHISLGSFFRDYLFYMTIFGKRRIYLNLFIVWFCTGIWHGASWNYVIWGLYFGLFILFETLLGKKRIKRIPLIIRHIYSKLVIIIGFGIFYFEDLHKLGDFFKNILFLNGNVFADEVTKISFANNAVLILASLLFCFPVLKIAGNLKNKSSRMMVAVNMAQVVTTAALMIICSIVLVNSTSSPFLYFRF